MEVGEGQHQLLKTSQKKLSFSKLVCYRKITPNWYKNIRKIIMCLACKLDGVGPVDNRPSTDKLHHFLLINQWTEVIVEQPRLHRRAREQKF